MQHSLQNYTREEIIDDTIQLFRILMDAMDKGNIQDAKAYVANGHNILNQLKMIDEENRRCQETLVNSLVSEGTILLMPKAGKGSLGRRPKQQPTPPTVS